MEFRKKDRSSCEKQKSGRFPARVFKEIDLQVPCRLVSLLERSLSEPICVSNIEKPMVGQKSHGRLLKVLLFLHNITTTSITIITL